MENNSWQRFIKRISIKADSDKLYKAWASQTGIEKWFLRQAEFISSGGVLRDRHQLVEKGDTYKWYWHGHPDSVVEQGKIREANGKDFFQFSFTANCIVSIHIKIEHGENIVELIQENIPVDEDPKTNLYIACGEGWTFYLANLKSILEGGIDLRNRNMLITGVINS